MFDAHSNFAYSLVAIAPSPSTTGTSLVLNTGGGAFMPAPPFNAVVWPQGFKPLGDNAEIVRVTDVVGDDITFVRGPQIDDPGGINRPILVGDQFGANVTFKTLVDIERSIPTEKSRVTPIESPDGIRTTFTLPDSTLVSQSVVATLNGLEEDVVVSGTSITFQDAPYSSDLILCRYLLLI